MKDRTNIIFICRRNSCRSQMAEGWARALLSECLVPYSAGVDSGSIDPRAVQVMAEVGIDISGYQSKRIDSVAALSFDYIVSVCDLSSSECPTFHGDGQHMSQPFDDPPKLALTEVSEEAKLKHYRRVRDEIREFIERLPELFAKSG